MNVVYVELYNIKELIWPFGYENLDLGLKIKVSIDREFYDEMQGINNNLPKSLEELHKIIKNNFMKNINHLKKLYGDVKIKCIKDCIEVENIHINYLTKNGILEEDVMFIVAYIFTCIENSKESTITELLKEMKKVSKIYHLKLQNGIEKIGKELKLKESRIEKENE